MLSLITLFVVMVGNDWALITDAYTDASSKFLRIYFFLWSVESLRAFFCGVIVYETFIFISISIFEGTFWWCSLLLIRRFRSSLTLTLSSKSARLRWLWTHSKNFDQVRRKNCNTTFMAEAVGAVGTQRESRKQNPSRVHRPPCNYNSSNELREKRRKRRGGGS